MAQQLLVSLDLLTTQASRSIAGTHAHTHTPLGRPPFDVTSARRKRPLPNTQHPQQTYIRVPGGIRTHNPSKQATADPRLRPRCHRDRPQTAVTTIKCVFQYEILAMCCCLATKCCQTSACYPLPPPEMGI